MKYTATVVHQPDVTLVVCEANEFPAGIKDSWRRLKSKLKTLRGRRFYGLTYFEDGQLVYYAALEPLSEHEMQVLGFPTRPLKGGRYARVKLMDWNRHADEIPAIFEELMETYKKDPQGPTVEFYRSQYELYLMIPLAEN
jgi:hypothetical protein